MKAKQTQAKKTNKQVSKLSSVRGQIKHHTKKVLVPHKENQFRPHIIRLHGIIAVLVIALLAQVTYGFVTTGKWEVLSKTADISTVDLLAKTNEERVSNGLGALQINDELSSAAFMKAQNMFAEDYWAHVSPSGVQPWKWFGDAGYNYKYAGENLAKNYPSAGSTVAAWMNSQTHRENILNDHYVDVGFAVVEGKLSGQETTIVVALYGAPAAKTVATTTTPTETPSETGASFTAPAVLGEASNPLTYFSNAFQSLSPVTSSVLVLLGIVALVGAIAHHYRKQLPRSWQKSWKMHHGFYTFTGMILLGVTIIIATGGGSI